jgi:hypothetical protein
MRTPAQRFRPAPPSALDRPQDNKASTGDEGAEPVQPPSRAVVALPAQAQPVGVLPAFELDMLVPASGTLSLGTQQLWLGPALSARIVTVWADRHSIHVSLDGAWIKTVPTRLSVEQLSTLAGRGSRPAGPAPAPPAVPSGRRRLSAAIVVDVDRTVDRDGVVNLGGQSVNVGGALAGQRVTLRLDGHLMRVIADGRLARTMPAPVPADQREHLTGARRAADATRPPASAMRVQRNIPADGVVMVAANACASDACTPARPSPSSSRTPTTACSTTTPNCPCTHAPAPAPSPGSKPRTASKSDPVKHHLKPRCQRCLEPSHRHHLDGE